MVQYYVQRMWQAKHRPASLRAELDDDDDDDRVAARKRGPLAKLAQLDVLPEWDGLTTKRRKTTVARWLHACAAALRALPRGSKRAAKLAIIERTVETINAWSGCDAIDTPEREALCTAFDDLVQLAGLRGHDLAGPYRDW